MDSFILSGEEWRLPSQQCYDLKSSLLWVKVISATQTSRTVDSSYSYSSSSYYYYYFEWVKGRWGQSKGVGSVHVAITAKYIHGCIDLYQPVPT